MDHVCANHLCKLGVSCYCKHLEDLDLVQTHFAAVVSVQIQGLLNSDTSLYLNVSEH